MSNERTIVRAFAIGMALSVACARLPAGAAEGDSPKVDVASNGIPTDIPGQAQPPEFKAKSIGVAQSINGLPLVVLIGLDDRTHLQRLSPDYSNRRQQKGPRLRLMC
jgi:hypothetical protein